MEDIKSWGVDFSSLDAVAICVDSEKLDFKKEDLLIQQAPNFLPGVSCPTYIVDHHYAHSLSCWPIIDVDKVDVAFVFDGVGDFYRTNTIFKKDKVVSSAIVSGVGVLLANWGRFAGVEGHALDISGKVMALKSYGKVNEKFVKEFSELDILEATRVFEFVNWLPYLRAKDNKFIELKPGSVDWIASIHSWIEDKFVEYFLKFASPDDVITFSGGIAQNICVNSRLKKVFKNLYIPPHTLDDGLSLGCVEFLRRHYDQPKFDNSNFPYWQSEDSPAIPTDETIDKVVDALVDGKIVGWFQGQGEVGPRALGNRSILMRPDLPNGKDFINSRVKFREEYRPFGCSVLEEHASQYFDCDFPSPYMLYSVPVKDSRLASITHVDGTSRIQTVSEDNTLFYKLLSKFYARTGLPILLNTSLNVNKKPIASTSEHAMGLFNTTELDVLCVGDAVYFKRG